jgi:hypothetical protein
VERDDLELCRLLAPRARRGALTPAESAVWAAAVERVFGRLLEIQNARAGAPHRARRDVRVRRVIPVEVRWGERVLRAVTLDLGLGGLSTLLDAAPRRGTEVTVRVALTGGAELAAPARVAGLAHRGGAVRVSFAFRRLAPEERSLLQSSLVEDAVALVGIAVLPPRTSS